MFGFSNDSESVGLQRGQNDTGREIECPTHPFHGHERMDVQFPVVCQVTQSAQRAGVPGHGQADWPLV